MAGQNVDLPFTPFTLGKYQVTARIGSGGFGAVYLAEDHILGRQVALKVLHPYLNAPDFLARFRSEARLAAGLHHTNIVAVYEMGQTEDGRAYMAMEYLPGGSVADRLARGPIPLAEIGYILQTACAGLQELHRRGLVHRDLKPANLLLNADGQAVLSDFGLARAVSLENTTSTMSGGGGTLFYKAPEVCDGTAPAGPPADVYSLGCILFEMLTGKVLFSGHTPEQVLTRHLIRGPEFGKDWPPPGTPLTVVALLQKALSRDPTQRYPDAAAFSAALQEALKLPQIPDVKDPPDPPRPPKARLHLSRPVIIGLIAGLVGLSLIVFLLSRFIFGSQDPFSLASVSASQTAQSINIPAAPLATVSFTQGTDALLTQQAASLSTPVPPTDISTLPPALIDTAVLSSTEVFVQTPLPVYPTTKVIGDGAYLRAGPSVYHPSASKVLTKGSVLTIIAQNSDGQWFLAKQQDNSEGWVWHEWIDMSFNVSEIAIAAVIPTPVPTFTPAVTKVPGLPDGFVFCSREGDRCKFVGSRIVAYGAMGKFNFRYDAKDGIECDNNTFGDPVYGVAKACYIK